MIIREYLAIIHSVALLMGELSLLVSNARVLLFNCILLLVAVMTLFKKIKNVVAYLNYLRSK